jgi:hypothetical protein
MSPRHWHRFPKDGHVLQDHGPAVWVSVMLAQISKGKMDMCYKIMALQFEQRKDGHVLQDHGPAVWVSEMLAQISKGKMDMCYKIMALQFESQWCWHRFPKERWTCATRSWPCSLSLRNVGTDFQRKDGHVLKDDGPAVWVSEMLAQISKGKMDMCYKITALQFESQRC